MTVPTITMKTDVDGKPFPPPKERPILFQGEMVRQILANTKTQTRRIAKWKPREAGLNLGFSGLDVGFYHSDLPSSGWVLRSRDGGGRWNDRTHPLHCPYGLPGDRLWVRENIWCANDTDGEMGEVFDCGSMLRLGEKYAQVQYAATPECCDPPELQGTETIETRCDGTHTHGHWWYGPPAGWDGESDYERGVGRWCFCPTAFWTKHPSIHMPRWACRLVLDVVAVRIERLQDISDEDARAEGMDWAAPQFYGKAPPDDDREDPRQVGYPPAGASFARDNYRRLWTKINGAGSWGENPHVWVITFKRVEHDGSAVHPLPDGFYDEDQPQTGT